MRRVLLAVLALVAMVPWHLSAEVVYSNGDPFAGTATTGPHYATSDTISPFQISADDFTLSKPVTIESVRWWGAWNFYVPSESDFIIKFYTDVNGLPNPGGNFAAQRIGNIAGKPTGQQRSFFEVLEFQSNISPVTLSANQRYWISIYDDSGTNDSQYFIWRATGIPDSAYVNDYFGWNNWQVWGDGLAFHLETERVLAPQALYLDFDGGFVNYRGDSFYMPSAALFDHEIENITNMVAKIFAPFNIRVSSTLSPPPANLYSTVFIGGDRDFLKNQTGVDSWWLRFWGNTTVGQAEAVDVRNDNREDNALVLSWELSDISSINSELIAHVIAHEAGHLLGLFHVDRRNQLMYPCASLNVAITNSFYRVANAGSEGCPDLDYALISNVNNYLALGKYVGLANGNKVDYDDGWWDTFSRRITLNPVWASSIVVYNAKLAVLYSDDAGPTLFDIGDLRDGDTYGVEAPITDWAKVYIYGSSVPGGAVDMYGSPNDIMETAPSDLSESDLAGYAYEVQEWRIYQHEQDLFTEIGEVGLDVEVENNKCDTNLDGRFDGRDVAKFVKGCGRVTAETAWCERNAKSQGKKWYDKRCPAEGVPWLCDVNGDGSFNGRDVSQFVKDCKRMQR